METVTEFLDKLAIKGVKLSSMAGQLKCYAPKGSLTPDIQEGIARHKPEIMALLDVASGGQQAQTVERSSAMTKEFPLSAGQKGLYILQSLHPDMGAYNVPICFKINGPVDIGILAKAWDSVLEQFPVLTARVIEKEEALYHRLDDACKTVIQQRNVDFADDEQFLSILRNQAKQPFDLNRGPLTRIDLFVRDKQRPVLLLTVHHIVFDGASAAIVVRSLLAFYQQLCEGKPVRLSHELQGYQAFVAWEEAMLASPEGAAHARYWGRQLEGELPAIEPLPDFPRLASPRFEGETLVEELPEDLSRSIADFSSAHSLPPSVIFLGVFQLLLRRYTNQDDIIVGMPVMGRAAQQFAEDVGYFINMVPIRAHCDDEKKMIDFLRTVRGTMLDALYHSSYPFPLMLSKAMSGRREVNPIFRVFYAYQNFFNPTDAASLLHQQALQIEPVAGIWQEGEFDLGLEIFESGTSSFIVHVKYNPDLYAQRTIMGVVEHYRVLLRAVSENPNLLLREYRLLTGHEERLLHEFNNTRAEYPGPQCIHELVAEQAAVDPAKTAVVCGDGELTYRELHDASRDLALYLQSQGVGPDRQVGVCMERSLDMVVTLLGILEAGGAYVPLDPDYPDERLTYVLRDSGATIVLTQDSLEERLRGLVPPGTQLVARDRRWPEIADRVAALKAADVQLQHEVRAHHLAYVIYTSGSTGQPKGVAIEHHSTVTLVQWARGVYSDEELAGVLASTSICFDLSVYEIFVTLASGGTVILVRNALALADGPSRKWVTLINTVPSAMEELLRLGAIPDSVQTINLAGEPLTPRLVDRIYETTSAAKVYDLYGPSEDTTYSTYILRKKNGPETIGRPIANTRIYILDAHDQLQPIGVPGELHIAGDGLARGYLNRPEMTDEKFVPNPFEPGTRMYKTGDLARWLDDGTLQYLGRIDHQVKVRGFRIELGEIEARLTEHERVREAVVVAREDTPGEKRLVAYYAPSINGNGAEAPEFLQRDLRAFLSEHLPEYMVPATYVPLDEIPLTPNGKVDRKALPAPEAGAVAARAYEPPQGDIEKTLAAICQELLHVERVGRHDSFFELGGHSLLATQLIAKIRSQLGVDLPLRTLFERPSVAQLAQSITTAEKRRVPVIRPVDRSRYRLA